MFTLALFKFFHLSLQLMSGIVEGQTALKVNPQHIFFFNLNSKHEIAVYGSEKECQKFPSPQTTRQI